ncbi:MAG: ABC-2 family transporter protein [Erysipelotrichaceae bacterium]|nr:ABC-2 family transporter protein [Erysipelotrichaceae bacterium]
MLRYLHLYKVFVKRAIKARLEYKADALIGILSFFISNIATFSCILLIVKAIPSLDGWSIFELGFLYGFAMLPKGLDHLFTDSLWFIGYWYVKNGFFDKHLIRPINTLFQVIAETFQPEAFGELIIGSALCIICAFKIDINFTFANVLLLIVSFIFGAFIFTGIKLITCSFAFYFKRSGQLMNSAYIFCDFARYPVSIFNKPMQFFLSFIMPFGLIISIPVQIVLKGTWNAYIVMLLIIAFAFIFNIIGILLWNKGVKAYESTGS